MVGVSLSSWTLSRAVQEGPADSIGRSVLLFFPNVSPLSPHLSLSLSHTHTHTLTHSHTHTHTHTPTHTYSHTHTHYTREHPTGNRVTYSAHTGPYTHPSTNTGTISNHSSDHDNHDDNSKRGREDGAWLPTDKTTGESNQFTKRAGSCRCTLIIPKLWNIS